MRRATSLIVVFWGLVLLVAGCGSTSHVVRRAAASAVQATELSYMAPGAPLVLSVATRTNPGVSSLTGQASAASGLAAIAAKLATLGIDYQRDIKPLLGNPVMLGAGAADLTGVSRNDFVIVWVTRSAPALSALLGKLPGFHPTSSFDGAQLYHLGKGALAVRGATVVAGASSAGVERALARHARGAGFSPGEYERLLTGLPKGAAVQLAGDLSGVLSTPKAAKARRVPWVAALRGYGVAIAGSSGRLSVSYRLDTSGASLRGGQLPIAAGSSVPRLAGSMPITIGLSDPAQTWHFIESVLQVTAPGKWRSFERRQASAKARTGTDLDELISRFNGDAIVASDTHTTIGRAAVSDPEGAAKALAALARDPSDALGPATRARSLGGGLYAIAQKHAMTINLGIVGNQFVIGRASPAALRAFAAAPSVPAAGARGSVAFRIDLATLLRAVAHAQAASPIVSVILARVGDLTGSAEASAGALTGVARLVLKSGG